MFIIRVDYDMAESERVETKAKKAEKGARVIKFKLFFCLLE